MYLSSIRSLAFSPRSFVNEGCSTRIGIIVFNCAATLSDEITIPAPLSKTSPSAPASVATQLKTIIPILVDHPSFTKDLGEKARARVLERYTITKNINSLEKVYMNLKDN